MFHFPKSSPKQARRIVLILLLSLVYYGTAEISRRVAATPQSVTPVWPPDGFALAAVLIYGYQILPGVFIGSFLANIWAFIKTDSLIHALISVRQVVAIACGTTIGIGLGKYLLDVQIRRRNPLKKLNDLCIFLFSVGILTPIINATVGVLALTICGTVPWANFNVVWLTWWISNVSGIYIFTPVLISWYEYLRLQKNRRRQRAFLSLSRYGQQLTTLLKNPKLFEALSLIAIIVLVSYASFYQSLHFEYMLIPCLVWAVVRFGTLGVTNLIALITMLAVFGTVRGLGSFSSEDVNNALIRLQLFTLVIVITNLSLMATLNEKTQTVTQLQRSKFRLQEKSNQLEASKTQLKETAQLLAQQNTALEEAKQTAEKASHTKTKFLSNMSHELRTPLNAILGLVEILKDSDNLDDFEKEDLETISDSGRHLLNLIEDILDISRIEAGKVELYPQEVDVFQFLQSIKGIIQSQIKQNVEFICDFAETLPPVIYVDEKRLRQVLLNLLHNAVKFTNRGHVIFRVQHQPNDDQNILNGDSTYVLLDFTVEDSGIGMEPDQLGFIFRPFEQTGKAKFKAKGTGLGLAISQEIVRLMGGEITVTSAPAVGSKFRFELCVDIPNAPQNPSSTNESLFAFDRDLAQKLPLKILLAEDNPTNQRVMTKILKNLGYGAVDVAGDGLTALAAVKDHAYDVILMDIQMPKMDGLETTRQLLALPLESRPYIIALTANAIEHDRIACLEAGMDDYVTKPVHLESLIQALWRSQSCRLNQEANFGLGNESSLRRMP
ncbi:MAG: MASE1 domain-containing protein [Synechococcus sp.]|nr:MASE1 domain-containing protein [Synechococcus sp.]